MAMIWFTSDTHFRHANILKYCDRPFADIDEHDDALVENWNLVVAPYDKVYHLGDFTLGGVDVAKLFFLQLNGRINVLGYPWHHDSRWLPDKPGESDELFSASGIPVNILPPIWVFGVDEYGDGNHDQYIALSHYPLAIWDRKHYGAWHLHGHTHGNYQGSGFIVDVGVDSLSHDMPVGQDQAVRMDEEPGSARGYRHPLIEAGHLHEHGRACNSVQNCLINAAITGRNNLFSEMLPASRSICSVNARRRRYPAFFFRCHDRPEDCGWRRC